MLLRQTQQTLQNFFSLFFCSQLLLAVVLLLQIRKKRTVDQVIKFRSTHLLQEKIALLHLALTRMSTYSYTAMHII